MRKMIQARWVWCLAAVLVLAGCTRSPERRAIDLCKAATAAEPRQPGIKYPKYEFILKPIGSHSFLVSRHIDLPTSPLIIDKTYIVFENKADMYSLEKLKEVFLADVSAAVTDAEQTATIKLFIDMTDRGEAMFVSKIIDRVDDIYNYKKAPLKPELEATIHPPKIEAMSDGKKKHTFFAHRLGSGTLRSYEFTFNRTGQLIDARYTEIGKGIGGVYFVD